MMSSINIYHLQSGKNMTARSYYMVLSLSFLTFLDTIPLLYYSLFGKVMSTAASYLHKIRAPFVFLNHMESGNESHSIEKDLQGSRSRGGLGRKRRGY